MSLPVVLRDEAFDHAGARRPGLGAAFATGGTGGPCHRCGQGL